MEISNLIFKSFIASALVFVVMVFYSLFQYREALHSYPFLKILFFGIIGIVAALVTAIILTMLSSLRKTWLGIGAINFACWILVTGILSIVHDKFISKHACQPFNVAIKANASKSVNPQINVVDKDAFEQTKLVFNKMESEGWDPNSLEWGYFFYHNSPELLKEFRTALEKDGYKFRELHQSKENQWMLQMSKKEIHTAESLHKSNMILKASATKFGIEYDGWDVGPVNEPPQDANS